MIAEIFPSRAAVFAGLVGAVQPGNANAVPDTMAVRAIAQLFHRANHLMSGNHGRFARRQFAFDDVQIGAAHTARADANQNFTVARRGNRRRRRNRADSFPPEPANAGDKLS